MQAQAANYLKYFSMDLDLEQRVSLHADADPGLLELVKIIDDTFGPGHLACIYEALCVVAESDFPYAGEVDGKICPPEVYFRVVDFLTERL